MHALTSQIAAQAQQSLCSNAHADGCWPAERLGLPRGQPQTHLIAAFLCTRRPYILISDIAGSFCNRVHWHARVHGCVEAVQDENWKWMVLHYKPAHKPAQFASVSRDNMLSSKIIQNTHSWTLCKAWLDRMCSWSMCFVELLIHRCQAGCVQVHQD